METQGGGVKIPPPLGIRVAIFSFGILGLTDITCLVLFNTLSYLLEIYLFGLT